jgi:hypothetical protein
MAYLSPITEAFEVLLAKPSQSETRMEMMLWEGKTIDKVLEFP